MEKIFEQTKLLPKDLNFLPKFFKIQSFQVNFINFGDHENGEIWQFLRIFPFLPNFRLL